MMATGAAGVPRDVFTPPLGAAGDIAPEYPGGPFSSGFYTENFDGRGEHTYRNHVEFAKALREYDPTADPDARFVGSWVPRASRVAPRASTQAKPLLDPRPGATEPSLPYMPLTSDKIRYEASEEYLTAYHGDRWNEFQFSRYSWSRNMFLSRQHAYRDIMGSWAASWELATVLFNPAYVDLAHRNGQFALGVVHGSYMGPAEPTSENDIANAQYSFVATDDNGYVYGLKLVDLAEYFGFDGVFLNFEAWMSASQAQRVMELNAFTKEYAAAQGLPDFHLQWYDSLRADGSVRYHNSLSDSTPTGSTTSRTTASSSTTGGARGRSRRRAPSRRSAASTPSSGCSSAWRWRTRPARIRR